MLIFLALIQKDIYAKSSLDLTLELSSDFIFRGESFGGEYVNRRNNTGYRSYTDSWSLQPDLLYQTPLKGLKILFWGNINLQHTRDRDSDHVLFQMGPGQEELFYTVTENLRGGIPFDPFNTKQYKEKNGLARQNGAFLGAYYEWKAKIGYWKFGTWLWTNADKSVKYTWQEYFIAYKPKYLKIVNAEISVYFNTSSSNLGDNDNPPNVTNGQNYISLDLSYKFLKGNKFNIIPYLHTGYIVNNDNLHQRSGISNITGGIKFVFRKKFFFGINMVHRPEPKLWDTRDNNPRDGNTPDPSKQYGLVDKAIYREIDQVYYNQPIMSTFVKEEYGAQTIVRNLYYINLGYMRRF